MIRAMRDLVDYLTMTVEMGGSDLHIVAGAPAAARVHGKLVPLEEFVFDGAQTKGLIFGALKESQRATLETEWELDFALQVDGVGRFRGNAHYIRGNVEGAFRHIPEVIPELTSLGHGAAVEAFAGANQGLVLVTGITGSGKSTTLAAMAKMICERRSAVIITIEDPIEFVFEHDTSLVKQRQVGTDTKSFPAALRSAMRQDPDVILVSEMRDLETIKTAITAAETGHLVLSTLHTQDAPKTIDRLIDVFPGDQQAQIVAQLANCLIGVISQRLIPRCDVEGRVLATEVLKVNHGVRTCIRDRKIEQIAGLIQIGAAEGMHTIDDSIVHLLTGGYISYEDAMMNARERDFVRDQWRIHKEAEARLEKKGK